MRLLTSTGLLVTAGTMLAGAALAQPGPGRGFGGGEYGQRLFGQLDTNGDGRVTWEEGWAVLTQRFQATDADRSGGLSLREFGSLHPELRRDFRPERPADAPQPPADRAERHAERHAAMFRGLDANRDGQVTLDELRPWAELRFRMADANGDGAIVREELPRRGPHHGPDQGPRREAAPAQPAPGR